MKSLPHHVRTKNGGERHCMILRSTVADSAMSELLHWEVYENATEHDDSLNVVISWQFYLSN